MTASTAADFFACNTRRIVPIAGLEQWNLSAAARSITEKERADYEASWLDGKKQSLDLDRLKLAKVKLIILVVCDDTGRQLFQRGDEPKLLKLDSALTSLLYNASRKHCGFDDGDIERLVGNSEPVPADASPSA